VFFFVGVCAVLSHTIFNASHARWPLLKEERPANANVAGRSDSLSDHDHITEQVPPSDQAAEVRTKSLFVLGESGSRKRCRYQLLANQIAATWTSASKARRR
jgi:hypothetical protein